MQNISIHMVIDNIQAKNFVKFDFVKIMIHLAWVANSMVIFSASYLPIQSRKHDDGGHLKAKFRASTGQKDKTAIIAMIY